jgi:hypothetical protein
VRRRIFCRVTEDEELDVVEGLTSSKKTKTEEEAVM